MVEATNKEPTVQFKAKKKVLQNTVNTVKSLTEAMSLSGKSDLVEFVAEDKAVLVRTASGPSFVEMVVQETIVEDAGTVTLQMESLTSALKVSGDTISFTAKDRVLAFQCGRSHGSIPLVPVPKNTTAEDYRKQLPDATTVIPALKPLLKAVAIKGKTGDRTFHVSSETRTIRAETTDDFRAATVLSPLGSKVPTSASLVLPHKAIDALASVFDTGKFGFSDQMVVFEAPGLFVSMPRSVDTPAQIEKAISGLLEEESVLGSFQVKVDELKSALADASALLGKDQDGLVLAFDSKGGYLSAQSASGQIAVDFEVLRPDGCLHMEVQPSMLKDSLDLYTMAEKVNVTVYQRLIIIDLDEPNELLTSQRMAVPMVTNAVLGLPAKKEEKKKKSRKTEE